MKEWVDIEVWHSRRNAPTRRVAAGKSTLTETNVISALDAITGLWVETTVNLTEDEQRELSRMLTDMLEEEKPVSRLKHRLQTDTVGLQKTTLRFFTDGSYFITEKTSVSPQQIVLGVTLSVSKLSNRKTLLEHLLACVGTESRSTTSWAAAILGIAESSPTEQTIRKHFRELAKNTHPDVTRNATKKDMAILVQAKQLLLEHASKEAVDD